jgi:hypothetical protein
MDKRQKIFALKDVKKLHPLFEVPLERAFPALGKFLSLFVKKS